MNLKLKSVVLVFLLISFLFSCDSKYPKTLNTYHNNGKLKMAAIFLDSIITVSKIYYPSGVMKSKFELHNDSVHGLMQHYYPSGNLKLEENYLYGKNNGDFISYFDNESRTVKEKCNFINDVIDGNYYKYFSNGSIKEIGYVKNGFLFYEEKFDIDGKVLQDFRSFEIINSNEIITDTVQFKVFGNLYDDLKIFGFFTKMIIHELPNDLHPIIVDRNGIGEVPIDTTFDDRSFGFLHLFSFRGDSCIENLCNIYRKEIVW